MTDDLKRKIAQIIAKNLCPNRKSHFFLYGDSADCYNRDNFVECTPICDAVDALIAAGIGDVKVEKKLPEERRVACEGYQPKTTNNGYQSLESSNLTPPNKGSNVQPAKCN